MKERFNPKGDIVCVAIAVAFGIMTLVFLTVPYALSAHPGEAPVATVAAERHLS